MSTVNISELIKGIIDATGQIFQTARDSNRASYTRREITQVGIRSIEELLQLNHELNKSFEHESNNLALMHNEVKESLNIVHTDLKLFNSIVKNISEASRSIYAIDGEIVSLTKLVEEIKKDTNKIFSLALNASIVSSKYTQTSGVFDVLANKLSEMAHFINQNLENITAVVRPITNGINKLTHTNSLLLVDFEKGISSFKELPEILGKQLISIQDLIERARNSRDTVSAQNMSLLEMKSQVEAADKDAVAAIDASGNVAKTSELLREKSEKISSQLSSGVNIVQAVNQLKDQAVTIWQSAQRVNEKSRSQFEVSLKSVDFCDSIVNESVDLKKNTIYFNEKTMENSKIALSVSENLGILTDQLDKMKSNIEVSSESISRFNKDYKQIDDIIQFLKNILKTMRLLGMYSRIESARDSDKFAGFITISNNIIKLQDDIHNNIPRIEQNITNTHELIESVNKSFVDISTVFYKIIDDSSSIINKLNKITEFTNTSEDISKKILTASETIEKLLGELKNALHNLTEIVKKPVDGSALNIQRGKLVESVCLDILAGLASTTQHQ